MEAEDCERLIESELWVIITHDGDGMPCRLKSSSCLHTVVAAVVVVTESTSNLE